MKEEYKDYEFPLGSEFIIQMDWNLTIKGMQNRFLEEIFSKFFIINYHLIINKFIKKILEGWK